MKIGHLHELGKEKQKSVFEFLIITQMSVLTLI